MKPTKYNPIIRYSILELYAEGLSLESIAKHCSISRRTLQYWINKYDLRPSMDEARKNRAVECIEKGLLRLSEGAEETVEEEKFIYNRRAKRFIFNDETGEYEEEDYIQPVEKTVKRKVKPPESKAIEILSRKYAKEFDSKAEERELSTKILEGFTMRELQEARKDNPIDKGRVIEAQFTELSTDE